MSFPRIYPLVEKIMLQPLGRGLLAPEGVTIHYTASPTVSSAVGSFAQSGFCYHLIVDRDGKVYQTLPLDQQAWHAGHADWAGKSPNKTHIAIAVVSWGQLDLDPARKAWVSFALTRVPDGQVAVRPGNLSNKAEGWHAAAPAQEAALMAVLRWAVANGIKPADICGHDEAALPAGRKPDPGGVLSLPMIRLRQQL